MTPERALLRLRQLAKEERMAIAARDVEALCRVTALLLPTMAALEGADLSDDPDVRQTVEEIQAAHRAAESFLTARMADASDALKRCAAARRVAQAYVKRRTRPARINNES